MRPTLIVLIAWFGVTYAQHFSPVLYLYAGYETHDSNQHTLLLTGVAEGLYSARYVMEYRVLPITILLRDPYNNNHLNFAFPIIPIVFFCTFPEEYTEKFGFHKIAMLSLGSQHHLYLWNEPLNWYGQKPQWISLFFKHNVEWFAFRAHQWIDFTPGLGVAFYCNYPASDVRFSIRLAAVRDIKTDLKVARYSTIYFIQFCMFHSS
jgi:hypothetical protein